MKIISIPGSCLAALLAFALASVAPTASAAQPQPAQAANSINLAKEVMDKKAVIVWRDAPTGAIPLDVCTILQACGGKTRLIALPAATESGIKVQRGLFLTQSADTKHTDMVVLERQTATDNYFYLIAPDGSLQKAAFVQLGSKQWSPIAASLAKPQFESEKKVWHDHVQKLGAAPAAAPAQGN